MKSIAILPAFERCVKKLTPFEKKQVVKALDNFNNYVLTGRVPAGLGFKKINHDKFEFRAGLRLRVVAKEASDVFYLVLVGTHEDIKRYLRDFR